MNEIIVFRIDLPCYPHLWTDPLFLQIDLLIQINTSSKAAKKYEIAEGGFAVIDSVKLRLNDPLSMYREFFEVNFDSVFCCHLDGMIHTGVLDFGYKPTILIGYTMWYDFSIPDCNSFGEFI